MAARRKPAKRKTTRRKKRAKKKGAAGKFFGSLIAILAVLYIGAGVYLHLNQRRFIYFPTGAPGAADAQGIEIQADGAVLRGWVVNPGREHAIIYFGGNAEHIENNIEDYRSLFHQHTVYFINYRGYGNSTGEPTQDNLFNDAELVFDTVSPQHDNVSVIGRSLGTGVATYLASVRDLHQLILVTPFADLADPAAKQYPYFPVKLILTDRFQSEMYAPNISEPTLIIIAENDEVIPRDSSNRLAEAFTDGTAVVAVIPGATHDGILDQTQYYIRMRDFQITGN